MYHVLAWLVLGLAVLGLSATIPLPPPDPTPPSTTDGGGASDPDG